MVLGYLIGALPVSKFGISFVMVIGVHSGSTIGVSVVMKLVAPVGSPLGNSLGIFLGLALGSHFDAWD